MANLRLNRPKTHLIIPDQHAHPDYGNDRADWMGRLIADVKPDVVINIGDGWDMASLSSYDKGKASFYGRNYASDVNSGLDFQQRMWEPTRKAKRKMPYKVFLEGNHEHRIHTCLDLEPQLAGEQYGVSFNDLDLDKYYNDVVKYVGKTPGLYSIDGITYAHFITSGLMGFPISGEHHANSLIVKKLSSCTVGHSHLLDFKVKSNISGNKVMGCVVGCYFDYVAPWAGHVCDLWWSGAVIKRDVHDGVYNPEFVSLDTLRKAYS